MIKGHLTEMTNKHTVIIASNIILNILYNYGPVLQVLSYLNVTMSRSSGLMDLRKFVFCFLIDVWINSKIHLNVSELILKYLQNISSSLSKSSRRLWNSLKLSRLELILCTYKRLFLVNKRLFHQISSINENTCTWFDILAVQNCQLHCFQFGSARLAMWIVTRSARFSSARLGLQCEWALYRRSVRLAWKRVSFSHPSPG